MCQRYTTPPSRGRRFPGGRFPDRGLTIPAPRPLKVPAPHRPPPTPLTPEFDGEPADPSQVAP